MHLISTRDSLGTPNTYCETLLTGLAPDGGLFIPSEYPQVSQGELESLKNSPYTNIAFQIKKKLISGDIDDVTLKDLVENAYTQEKFPNSVDGNITPVRKIDKNLYIQNLSLGPTAAFKDMAMQQLGQEMNYELTKRGENLTILGATSGDTGSAAEAAMKGLDAITLFMLSPQIGMSDFQKAQMGNLSGDNIFNISVDGCFDDCQDMVKDLKNSPEFSHLGAVNSINWGRISSQVPYYFSGYLQTVDEVGEEIDVCVPSGNFGNVLSAYIAKKMGLPIRRLIIATNENDVLHKVFSTGVYEITPSSITSSPSMDISKASNYERLVFDLLGRDGAKTEKYMQEFADKKTVDLADYGVSVEDLKSQGFISGSSSHADRLSMIEWVYEVSKTIIDPHTADSIKVSLELRDPNIKTICMETALPVKFEDTIEKALGFIPERPAIFESLEAQNNEKAFQKMGTDREQLKNFIEDNS
ncbi:threonine synthase [Candidatus Gracilibacteria bacterium]|nr:threonine synthase [Candidatus Gracilibacteria bacterium]